MRICLVILSSFLFFISNQAFSTVLDEAWNESNNPNHFKVIKGKLEALATEGMLADENYPWSDGYWPLYAGGISQRWQNQSITSKNYQDYLYNLISSDEIKNYIMHGKTATIEVKFLSPAEKYDLYVGNYHFPNVLSERNWIMASVDPQTNNVPSWMGWCDGWSAASVSEPEPGPVAIVTNADGITIPFFTSDINALMTKIYSQISPEWTRTGAICKTASDAIKYTADGRIEQSDCRDVNPGTLHLIMAQRFGNPKVTERKAFIADIDFSAEIWNQPIVGFKVVKKTIVTYDPKTDIRAQYRVEGTTQLVHLKTQMFYIEEIPPHSKPAKANKSEYTGKINLEYTLELDKEGYIIGGEWLNNDFPDFIWELYGTVTGNERLNYSVVKKLLELSRSAN